MNISPAELTAALANPDIAVEGEYTAVPPAPRRNKYNAVPTEVDGIVFASKREARYYQLLKQLETAGMIKNLVCQPKYTFVINGVKIGTYRPDFQYLDNEQLVVVDVKSKATKTRDYRLRKRLMLACHRIEVLEVE